MDPKVEKELRLLERDLDDLERALQASLEGIDRVLSRISSTEQKIVRMKTRALREEIKEGHEVQA